MQISYREIIDNEAEYTGNVEDMFDDKHTQSCSLKFKVEPSKNQTEKFKGVSFLNFLIIIQQLLGYN